MIKIWNGRSQGFFQNGHFYVCAETQKEACKLLSKAASWGPLKVTSYEIRKHYSETWGDSMEGIIPEIGVWVTETYSSKPQRIVWPEETTVQFLFFFYDDNLGFSRIAQQGNTLSKWLTKYANYKRNNIPLIKRPLVHCSWNENEREEWYIPDSRNEGELQKIRDLLLAAYSSFEFNVRSKILFSSLESGSCPFGHRGCMTSECWRIQR